MNLCIIQARMGSTRLPGKVLKKVNGISLLEYQINRLKLAKKIHKIIIATSTDKSNGRLVVLGKHLKIPVFRGSENDVLDRFYRATLNYPSCQNIIRATADCPLIDPVVVDQVIEFFKTAKLDYASNVSPATYPDGLDIEIFKKSVLIQSAKQARLVSEREHVTLHIRNKMKIKKGNLTAPHDFSHFRLTVDNQEDFEVIKFLIQHSKLTDGYLNYIALLTKNPEIMFKNTHIQRNEGYLKSIKNDYKISTIRH